MARDPLPALVSAIHGTGYGRAAIVVGGGPSAPNDLKRVSRWLPNALVIGANAHAPKLGLDADYVYCKDHINTETRQPQEAAMRALGVPLVSSHYWADYRTPLWPVSGNSGMMAIGLAAALGCAPILPLGFDCFQGATYFHDPDRKNVSLRRPLGSWEARLKRLAAVLAGAVVRPLSGPLLKAFPPYTDGEIYPRAAMPVALQKYADMPTFRVRALSNFSLPFDSRAAIPPGTVFAVTADEQRRLMRLGCVETLGEVAPWRLARAKPGAAASWP